MVVNNEIYLLRQDIQGGIYVEGQFRISWESTVRELQNQGSPECKSDSYSTLLTWKDRIVFHKLRCAVSAWFNSTEVLAGVKLDYHPWWIKDDTKETFWDAQRIMEDLFGRPDFTGLIGTEKFPFFLWTVDNITIVHHQFEDHALFNYLVIRKCKDVSIYYEFWKQIEWTHIDG